MFSDKRLLTSRKGPRDSGIGYREVFYVFVYPETRYPSPELDVAGNHRRIDGIMGE
jgi:hypothetical protein